MTWQRTALWILAAGMIFSGAGACSGKSVVQSSPPDKQTDSSKIILDAKSLNGFAVPNAPEEGQPEGSGIAIEEKNLTVPGEILNKPDRFESGAVTVRGVFHGWRGPCPGGPPVSRSDWMIADSSGCLYVHGPVPIGLDPARPSGETISVTGVVRMKNGRPYLEAGRPNQ